MELLSVAFDVLLAHLDEGVIVVDPQGQVIDLNRTARDLLNLRHDVVDLSVEQIFFFCPQILQANHVQRVECIGANGLTRVLSLDAFPILGDDEQPDGRVILIRDVTSHIQVDDQLRQLAQAVEQSPATVVITDLQGEIVYVNPQFTELTGYTFAEAQGENPRILKTGHTPPDVYRQMWQTIQSGGVWRGEFLNKKKNGELYWELAVISGVKDNYGNVTHYVAVKENITALKQLQQAEREQRILAEALNDVMIALTSTLDRETLLDRLLENVGRVLPYDAADIVLIENEKACYARVRGFDHYGIDLDQLYSLSFPAGYYFAWRVMSQTGQPYFNSNVLNDSAWVFTAESEWVRSFVGAPIIVQDKMIGIVELYSAQPGFYTQHHAGRLQAFANTAAIAIENARLYTEVEHLSIMDELTGVYNFRGLMLLGSREFDHARRFGRLLTVLFYDIDHFRDFNNQYSHAVGNVVLRSVAQRTLSHVRQVDLVARFGGEEFAVLLPEVDLRCAQQVAERLRQEIEQHQVSTEHGLLGVTISIGVAELEHDMPDLAALLEHANQAEHLAKAHGRNRVEITKH